MSSLARRWIAIGALIGAIGVAFGAFAAHGLTDYLKSLGYAGDDLAHRLKIFDIAVHYQLLSAVALVLTGLALDRVAAPAWRFAAWSLLTGLLFFSGLLKVLAFAGPSWNWLGAVVPIGGVAMIAGWLALHGAGA